MKYLPVITAVVAIASFCLSQADSSQGAPAPSPAVEEATSRSPSPAPSPEASGSSESSMSASVSTGSSSGSSMDYGPPIKLEGKCLEAHCNLASTILKGGLSTQMIMQQYDTTGIPECCLERSFGGSYQDPQCIVTPTTTTAAPSTSCMGDQAPLQVGFQLMQQCSPPDLTYTGYPCDYYNCSAPCSQQVIAFNESFPMGIVSKLDGSAVTKEDLGEPNDEYGMYVRVTADNLADMNAKFVLRRSCQSMMQEIFKQMAPSDEDEHCPPDVGQIYCTGSNRDHFIESLQARETQMKLQKSGECDFGMGPTIQMNDNSTCAMLDLNPTKTMYFLCGKTDIDGKSAYCGDWVSKQDGQCHENFYEDCSISTGPVHVSSSECADNAFLKKLVRGSDENPYCGPLRRGGCCVASMFHALTDDDENSMWPLCVRTWATTTCGVDLSTTCTNQEVELTLNVEVTMTMVTTRRLGDVSTGCTDNEARQLSAKIGAALAKSKASSAGARPVVISDSACVDSTGERKIVIDLVLQGVDAAARQTTVASAVNSADFKTYLQEEGVDFASISVRGVVNGTETDGCWLSSSLKTLTLFVVLFSWY